MTDTTMNTGAASLSDERIDWIANCHCPGGTAYPANVKNAIREAWREATPQADADFKNFHRLLCERFGYVHDERDWKRDQLSLIEHIASGAAIAAGGAQEPIYVRATDLDSLKDRRRVAGKGCLMSKEPREGFVPLYAKPLPRVAAPVGLTDEQIAALRIAADALVEKYAGPIREILKNAEHAAPAASNGEQ